MKEFLLSRCELLALMSAVNTARIPGIDNDQLVPDTQNEQRKLALLGVEQLQRRQLLREENGNRVLDGDLGLMLLALTDPKVMTLITRDTPGLGQQQFLYYRADPVNVELTMPTSSEYRLTALPNALTALARMRQYLPVTAVEDPLQVEQLLALEAFYRVKALAEQGQTTAATAALQSAGFSTEAADGFVQTLYRPELGGTIAFLRLTNQQIIDGRNLAMVSDATVAWLLRPSPADERRLLVESVTAAQYSAALLDAFDDLSGDKSLAG